jgi:hypothetical protein
MTNKNFSENQKYRANRVLLRELLTGGASIMRVGDRVKDRVLYTTLGFVGKSFYCPVKILKGQYSLVDNKREIYLLLKNGKVQTSFKVYATDKLFPELAALEQGCVLLKLLPFGTETRIKYYIDRIIPISEEQYLYENLIGLAQLVDRISVIFSLQKILKEKNDFLSKKTAFLNSAKTLVGDPEMLNLELIDLNKSLRNIENLQLVKENSLLLGLISSEKLLQKNNELLDFTQRAIDLE